MNCSVGGDWGWPSEAEIVLEPAGESGRMACSLPIDLKVHSVFGGDFSCERLLMHAESGGPYVRKQCAESGASMNLEHALE
jgi:hypothetical protein